MPSPSLKKAVCETLDLALLDGDLSDLNNDLAELFEGEDISPEEFLAGIDITLGRHNLPGCMPDDETIVFTFDPDERVNTLLEMMDRYYDSDESITDEAREAMKAEVSALPNQPDIAWYGPDGHVFVLNTFPVTEYLEMLGHELDMDNISDAVSPE